MTPSKPSPDASGDALLGIISFAVIATVAAESAFIYWSAWALLPLIMLFVLLAAAGVVAAVARLVEHGELATAPRSREPAPEPKAVTARPVLG